jgi:hypothetical protein
MTTSLIATSQIHRYQSSTIDIDYCDGIGYRGPVINVTDIYVDFDEEVIVISGVDSYSINYTNKKQYKDYSVLSCSVYDSNGVNCTIDFFLYEKRFYMKVIYLNFIFKYRINYDHVIIDNVYTE